MFADHHPRDARLGDLGKGAQALPATPSGRLRRCRTDHIADDGVQPVRTDQHIAAHGAAIGHLEVNPVPRIDNRVRTGTAVDALGREAGEQAVQQDPSRDHPDGRAQPVCDRVQIDRGQRATRRSRGPHLGQQLAGAGHVDAELLEDRRSVGPDRHCPAAGGNVRALVEDGNVVAVAQQSAGGGNAAHARTDDEDPQRSHDR